MHSTMQLSRLSSRLLPSCAFCRAWGDQQNNNIGTQEKSIQFILVDSAQQACCALTFKTTELAVTGLPSQRLSEPSARVSAPRHQTPASAKTRSFSKESA